MKVLWITMNAGLYDAKKGDSYGGTGWIGALYEQLHKYYKEIELGLAFLYDKDQDKEVIEGVSYYPIKNKKPTGFKKFMYYWRNHKKRSATDYLDEIKSVVDDFNPDVIHLWGVENILGSAALIKDVPVVAHLQGLLSLSIYIYYPYGFNSYSYRLNKFSVREHIFNNGSVFAEQDMRVRAEFEKKYLQSVPYVMGRTAWDKKVAEFNNPNVKYFHVNEALRSEYYSAKPWSKTRSGKFIIYSTISETTYKGLDTIMKTASIQKEYGYLEFEWRVAGIAYGEFVRYFEINIGMLIADLNIKLLGHQTPKQMIHGLQNSDLYVHPSYIDNSPNSLCEAQYLGLPIIATNVGGVSTLVEHEKTGLLVPANAPYDMAFAIKDCYDDEQKWQKWASLGMKAAHERHNRETIVGDLINVYSQIVHL